MDATSRNLLQSNRAAFEREFRSIAQWWLDHVVDARRGRIAGEVSDRNRRRRFAGLNQVYVARLTWFFSAASRFNARPEYRNAADCCRLLLENLFLDPEYGGMIWEVDWRSRPRPGRSKLCYGNAFAAYALSEYALAFDDAESLALAKRLMGWLETTFLDPQTGLYAEACARDGTVLEGKNVDNVAADRTMNTHLHVVEAHTALCQARPEPAAAADLARVLALLRDRFFRADGRGLERFLDANGTPLPAPPSPGHDIEASWLMMEAAACLDNAPLSSWVRKAALHLARGVLENGIDQHGGIPLERFGGEQATRHEWWGQAEALVGFFNAWQETRETDFLAASLDRWAFIRSQHRCARYGEWYWASSFGRAGTARYKAGPWKGPYHNGRAMLEMVRRIDAELDNAETHA